MANEHDEVAADLEATLLSSAAQQAISPNDELHVLNDAVPQMPSYVTKDLLSIGVRFLVFEPFTRT